MRVTFILIAVIIVVLGNAARGVACDCITLSEEESFNRAESVFVGEAIQRDESASEVTTVFRVKKSLKGKNPPELSITGTRSNCDSNFTVGWEYVVYARRFDNKFISSVCSGTETLGLSAESLQASKTPPPSPSFKNWQILTIGALSVLMFSLAGLFAGKVWRSAT